MKIAVLALACAGCGLTYVDQIRPSGLTNYRVLLPPTPDVAGIHTTGIPTTKAAQDDLRVLVEAPGRKTVRFSFHDAVEGDESWVYGFGWTFEPWPMVPEDDAPLSVFLRPDPATVLGARDKIVLYHRLGYTVVMGCVHNRERGQLEAGLVGVALLGWSTKQAASYGEQNGSRWRWDPGMIAAYLTWLPPNAR